MGIRTYRTFQALILGALGVWLLFKVTDGRILFYINQRFVILVLLAAVGFIMLAQVVLSARPAVSVAEVEGHEHHEHGERRGWVLWLVALPLLIGLLVPVRPLGTSAIYNRGINTGGGQSGRGAGLWAGAALTPSERSVYDWVQAFNEGALVEKEQADVTGFVYHDARLPEDAFLVGRFTIACCVADALAYGLAVSWPEGQDLPDNSWVRVRGPVQVMNLNDERTIPVIRAEKVERIPEPEQPYLFP